MINGDLCTILKTLRSVCAAQKINGTRIGTERVVIGYVSPEQVGPDPVAMLWWRGDGGVLADDRLAHSVDIMLGVQINYDDSDVTLEENALLQATAVYFGLFDALFWAGRNLQEAGLTDAGVRTLKAKQQGLPEDYATPGPVWAATAFDCQYNRALPVKPGT